jgi:mono/diheme cytochrome c family protein
MPPPHGISFATDQDGGAKVPMHCDEIPASFLNVAAAFEKRAVADGIIRASRLLRAATVVAATLVSVGCATVGGSIAPDDAVSAADGNRRTTRDGAFTAEQAARGKRVYDNYCFNCHPAAYYEARLQIWENASVGQLFDTLSSTMPEENPGVLSNDEYLDVLAYILSITGSPSGDSELATSNMEAITIVIE